MKILMKNSLDIFRKVEKNFRVIDYVKVLFSLEKYHEIFTGLDLYLDGSYQLKMRQSFHISESFFNKKSISTSYQQSIKNLFHSFNHFCK